MPTWASVQARLPLAVALVLASVVLGVAYLVLGGHTFVARDVAITGTKRIPAADVRRAAKVPVRVPLPLVNTAQLERRIESLPGVASARVVRDWPRGLRVTVAERVALLAVPDAGRFRLVDSEGVVVSSVSARPRRVPIVLVPASGGESAAVGTAAHVLESLPLSLRRSTTHLEVAASGGVTLLLRDDRRVVWGGADRSTTKAAVLTALVGRKGRVIDVSSPDLVTVSR